MEWVVAYVRIHSTHKTVGKTYSEILKYKLMDALLSHEATGEEMWMTAKRRNWRCKSHDSDNMADVVHLDFIHTTYVHAIQNILF